MVSSELLELLSMSDKILVMRHGRVAGEIPREEATEERVLNLALGLAHPKDSPSQSDPKNSPSLEPTPRIR